MKKGQVQEGITERIEFPNKGIVIVEEEGGQSKCVVKNASVSCVYADEDESGDKAGIIVGQFARGIISTDTASITNCSATDCTVDADRDAGKIIGCLNNDATQSGNRATRVTVSCNNSGVGFTTKTNTNIKNEIVGRVA